MNFLSEEFIQIGIKWNNFGFTANKPKQIPINQNTQRVYKYEKPLKEAYYKCYK